MNAGITGEILRIGGGQSLTLSLNPRPFTNRSLGGGVLWPDRHGNAVRRIWRCPLRQAIAFRQPDELRRPRIGNDPLHG